MDLGEKKIDKPLCRGLRLMVGKARPLIGFDEYIIWLSVIFDHKVNTRYGYIDGFGRLNGSVDELRMHFFGHIDNRSAGVQIGGFTHQKLHTSLGNGIHFVTSQSHTAFRFRILGNNGSLHR